MLIDGYQDYQNAIHLAKWNSGVLCYRQLLYPFSRKAQMQCLLWSDDGNMEPLGFVRGWACLKLDGIELWRLD